MSLTRQFITLLCCISLAATAAVANDDNTQFARLILPSDNVVAPSPGAAAVQRFEDFPVNYSSGTAGINVPLFSWNVGSYAFDLSLSYQIASIRVNDASSSVGTGWKLNGPGMISRSVCGFPDEMTDRDLRVPASYLSFGELKAAHHDSLDVNLDRFSYSFPGYSGVFYITGLRSGMPVIHNMGFNDLRIELINHTSGNIGDFAVTTPDGVRYTFDVREETEHEFTPPGYFPAKAANRKFQFVATWFLREIALPDSPDVITYGYEEFPTRTESGSAPNEFTYTFVGPVDPEDGAGTVSTSQTGALGRIRSTKYIKPKALKSITSRTATITFENEYGGTGGTNPVAFINSIDVTNPLGRNVRHMELTINSYAHHPQLTCVEIMCGDSVVDRREFVYHNSAGTVTEDLFGFHNNYDHKPSNVTTGIWKYNNVLNSDLVLGEHREANGEAAVMGMLKQATDLRGCRTTFRFEPRTIPDPWAGDPNDPMATHRPEKEIQPNPWWNGYDKPGDKIIEFEYTWPVDTIIGMRLAEITTEDEYRTLRRRFEYEQPLCTVDFSTIYAGAFIALSGEYFKDYSVRGNGSDGEGGGGSPTENLMHYQREIAGTTTVKSSGAGYIEMRQLSATMTSSSRMPGFPLSNAEINYGKVTEYIEAFSTTPFGEETDTVRTANIYEYDTSVAVHRRMPTGRGFRTHRQGDKSGRSSFLGVDILTFQPWVTTGKPFLGHKPVDGYFRETVGGEPLLVRRTECVVRNGALLPKSTVSYGYTRGRSAEMTIGHHVESLIYSEYTQDMVREDFREESDFNTFPVKIFACEWLCDTVRTVSFDDAGREHSIDRVTERYGPGLPAIRPDRMFGDTLAAPTLLPLPRRTVLTCGDQQVERHYVYAANASLSPVLNDLRTRRPSLPLAEALICGSDTVVTTTSYADFPTTALACRLLPAKIEARKTASPAARTIRFLEYNNRCMPTRVQTDGATPMVYQWDMYDNLTMLRPSTGSHLLSTFTHIPLIGCTSATAPGNIRTSYIYEGGRLVATLDTDGHTTASWKYEFYGEDSRNAIMATTYGGTNCSVPRSVMSVTDGFGDEWLSLAMDAGGDGRTLVTRTDLDGLGRPLKQWLTVPESESFSPEGISSFFGGDNSPFTRCSYDNTTRDNVSAITAAGDAMQGHSSENYTCFNTSPGSGQILLAGNGALRYEPVEGTSLLKACGYWPQGVLTESHTTDADGRRLITYTDFRGNVVLERRYVSGSGTRAVYADTYFAYDNLGRTVAVLPPLMRHPQSGTIDMDTDPDFLNLCYRYTYDSRMRLASKKLPGCEPVLMGYDSAGELTLTSDGEQRARGEVTFMLRDRFGRPTLSGIARRSTVTGLEETLGHAEYKPSSQAADATTGYAIRLPLDISEVLKVVYYDNYDFLRLTEFRAMADQIYADTARTANGAVTGTMTRILADSHTRVDINTATWMKAATFYDAKLRPVQSFVLGVTGELSATETGYNFDSSPNYTNNTLTWDDGIGSSLYCGFDYDNMGRQTSRSVIASTSAATVRPPQVKTITTYDALGRVASVTPHSKSPAITYSYNLRSQLRSITSTPFSQTLFYEDGATPQYAGGISSVTWSGGNDKGVTRRYDYTYDTLNRLTAARYSSSAADGADFSTSYAYDLNSNIYSLSRRGPDGTGAYSLVDQLIYSYDGNRITRIHDRVAEVLLESSMDYHPLASGSSEPTRTYDRNGRLKSDSDRGISSISYNAVGLPQLIRFENSNTLSFVYDADGNKLAEYSVTAPIIQSFPPIPVKNYNKATTYWFGAHVYKRPRLDANLELSHIMLPDGYWANGGYITHYRDYLGAVRTSVLGRRVQASADYYPYGTPFADGQGLASPTDRRLFGDKELIRFNSYNTYDYTARQYPAAAATFDTPDPLCEQFYWMSPYSFCGGNPIARIDPSGMEWVNQSVADDLKSSIQSKITENNAKIEENTKKTETETNSRKLKKLNGRIKELKQRNACLNRTISTIDDMTNDTENLYDLTYEYGIEESHLQKVETSKGSALQIVAANESFAIHEITHVQQYRDNPGDFDFSESSELTYARGKAREATIYEIQAYRHQYAFKPETLPSSHYGYVNGIQSINSNYVAGISKMSNPTKPEHFVYKSVNMWHDYMIRTKQSTHISFPYMDDIP